MFRPLALSSEKSRTAQGDIPEHRGQARTVFRIFPPRYISGEQTLRDLDVRGFRQNSLPKRLKASEHDAGDCE